MVQPTTERGNCSDLVGWLGIQAETSQENVFYLYFSADIGYFGANPFPFLNYSSTELARGAIEKLFSDFNEQYLASLQGLWSSGTNHKVCVLSEMKHCFLSSFISMTATI